MDDDLYDEFGNYIGPDLGSGDSSGSDHSDDELSRDDEFDDEADADAEDVDGGYNNSSNNNMHPPYSSASSSSSAGGGGGSGGTSETRIILHEDKKYYPDASEVYPGAKAVTMDEDAQNISEPVIQPIKVKNFSVQMKEAPALNYSPEFMATLMNTPLLIRHVALVGQLHHGKTLFADTLIAATHEEEWDPKKELRYCDTRLDEQAREVSVKSTCVSLVMENLSGKSFLLNVLDCPGHVNFSDEVTAAIRVADGVVVVVDAVEGVMMNTERSILQALNANIKIVLVINKIDRLILELKLPPQDAYFKLLNTIEEINNLLIDNTKVGEPQRLSPELGNVCFASAAHGFSFTLQSFAAIYAKKHGNKINSGEFAKRLWGNWYHNEDTGTFTRKKASANVTRTFVKFVLDPLYKLYSMVVGEEPEDLKVAMKRLGVILKTKEIHLDPKPLLRLCLSRYFGYPRGFVEMLVTHIPSPKDGNENKVASHYSGYQSADIAQDMRSCNSRKPLMAHVVKLYNTSDGERFMALTRIFSGSISKGQKLRVLGEGFSFEDDEDMNIAEVSSISVGVGRFTIEVNSAIAGNLVLLEGVDNNIRKTATITDMELEDIAIFKPLKFDTKSVFKVAVEPHTPGDLPKMVEALRSIDKSYPLVSTKVEDSGEHVIVGTGELYMDCILHDLRHLYTDMEIKVSDPVVTFCETVSESSTLKLYSETTNKRNRLAMTAEPLDKGLGVDIEKERVSLKNDKKVTSDYLKTAYDWDLLASRSIWAFGPTDCGANVLMDDTLPSEVNKSLLNAVRESVVQGFRWGCREGPLCDEPIRDVKFKILDATIAAEPIARGGGQIIPAARRSVYSSFLLGCPRLMEPVYSMEIQCPADVVQSIYPVLARRRGHLVKDVPKPGAPFYTVKAYIPVIDSFGFETDLRSFTHGQAFCQSTFSHWSIVSGDPLDRSILLQPLEPAPPIGLARDLMIKTRRRKGLNEDVSITKYIDDPHMLELVRQAQVNGLNI